MCLSIRIVVEGFLGFDVFVFVVFVVGLENLDGVVFEFGVIVVE